VAFPEPGPGYFPDEMRQLLVFGVLGASLALAGATNSARAPTSLLTYSAGPSSGLCLARPDGSRRVRLLAGEARAPSWSPDGRFVAFARDGKIVVANARGRIVRRFGSLATDPAWSPNGSRIAYVGGSPTPRIIVASRDGRTLTSISTGRNVTSGPTWSPNSRRLAYADQLDIDRPSQAGSNRVFVINADGSGRRLLVGSAAEPAWSPDGSRIAYVGYASRLSETGQIAVIGVDGADARRVTSGDEPETGPAWSPNGRLIAFARRVASSSVVLAIRPDGTGERTLIPARSGGASEPAWRRPIALPRARRASCP
jgi:Tol biopolymer transport system component